MSFKTITGAVNSVKAGKPFDMAGFGTLVPQNITIHTDGGEDVTVTKNTKSTTNFNLPPGTLVSATFESKNVTTKTGTVFTNNKLVKDGLVVLTNGSKEIQAANAPTMPKTSEDFRSVPKTSGYNAEGARNGMLVGQSVALATARKELTLDGLIAAALDVKALTDFIETGTTPVVAKTTKKAAQPARSTLPKEEPPFESDESFNDDLFAG